jgi:SAM-dependent methyltransferase
MMRAVKNPQADVHFTITVEGCGSMPWQCSRFLKPLPVEEQAIRTHLVPLDKKGPFQVLDIGCGVGRHLGFIRGNFNNAHLLGTEIDQTLRDYCGHKFGATMRPNLVWPGYDEIQASELDVVLLLGNGIGLYEQPKHLEKGLDNIFKLLRPGGVLIGECGSLPDTSDYSAKKVTITFEEVLPAAFQTLFCVWKWLRPILQNAGFEIIQEEDISSDEPGGFLFVAQKLTYPTKYYQSLLSQYSPEDRATASGTTPFRPLEDVLRIAQSRSARLPRGSTPEDHVRYHTAKNQVFFYPACGVDWEPLFRFPGRCDTFIYCDYMFTLEQVVDELGKRLPHSLQIVRSDVIPQDFVQAMTSDSLMPEENRRGHLMVEPWGCLLSLICHVTKRPKRLHLLYLGVEGVTLYSNLFTRHRHRFLKWVWAPEYLCIKNDGMGFGNGWADFQDWQRPLGRIVDQNPKKPKYVACSGPNWPWNQCWLTFNTWRGEFPGRVFVHHRPEITPTAREGRDFCLPEIPPNEWPEIAAVTPQPPLP